jgi:hypothetical protein
MEDGFSSCRDAKQVAGVRTRPGQFRNNDVPLSEHPGADTVQDEVSHQRLALYESCSGFYLILFLFGVWQTLDRCDLASLLWRRDIPFDLQTEFSARRM